jgi:hypothetical protein
MLFQKDHELIWILVIGFLTFQLYKTKGSNIWQPKQQAKIVVRQISTYPELQVTSTGIAFKQE